MRNMVKLVVTVMFAAIGFSAAAQIIIPSTTVTFDGEGAPGYQLSITYEVTESAGLYTYSYDLVTTPGVPMLSFTIGGTPDPIDTDSVVISNYGLSDPSSSGPTADSVVFNWALLAGITNDAVAFTSTNGPNYATFVLNGDGVVWGSPASIPAPAPVPEVSTIFAGVMMIIPFGIGAFRALRKDRGPK
jgi:hypothetical protein